MTVGVQLRIIVLSYKTFSISANTKAHYLPLVSCLCTFNTKSPRCQNDFLATLSSTLGKPLPVTKAVTDVAGKKNMINNVARFAYAVL